MEFDITMALRAIWDIIFYRPENILMCDPVTLTIIGLGLTATAAGGQAYTSKRAGDKAELQVDRQDAEQAALLKAEQDRQAEADKVAGLSADMARKRQRQKASGWGSNTILTSPLGLPGAAPTANKTLLGQ